MKSRFCCLSWIFSMFVLLSQVFVVQSCTKSTPNKIPVISAVIVNPETVYAFGTAKVKVEASDPDNDKLTFTYQSFGGSITGNESIGIWTAPGAWTTDTVTIIVNDGNGGEVSAKAYLNTKEIATQISGYIQVPENIIGNLYLTKVSIYSDYDKWLQNIPLQSVDIGDEGSQVAYNMVGVAPGNYYIDIWKDADANGKWSYGDYVGWNGTGELNNPELEQITVVGGQTTICNITNVFVVSL